MLWLLQHPLGSWNRYAWNQLLRFNISGLLGRHSEPARMQRRTVRIKLTNTPWQATARSAASPREIAERVQTAGRLVEEAFGGLNAVD